ncbi:hypothetical protein POKO110462_17385 [Pontibacter korlensis]
MLCANSKGIWNCSWGSKKLEAQQKYLKETENRICSNKRKPKGILQAFNLIILLIAFSLPAFAQTDKTMSAGPAVTISGFTDIFMHMILTGLKLTSGSLSSTTTTDITSLT